MRVCVIVVMVGGGNKERHGGRTRDRGRARTDKLFRPARTVGELQLGSHQNCARPPPQELRQGKNF